MTRVMAAASMTVLLAAGAGARAEECPCPSPSPGRDPNYARLLFAPTARPLARGEGTLSDYELVFPGMAYGLTDNFSLAGGVSVIPELGLREQVFYVAPKLGWNIGDKAAVAIGGLGATVGDDHRDSLGIGYVMGTFGGRDRSVSIGLGALRASHTGTTTPLLMLGGNVTVSRHVALVGETWLALNEGYGAAEQPIGLGVRFFGERLSADVGVVVIGALLDEGFPAPWASVSYHFGGKR
jgi:hypothetical protein